MSTIIGEVSIPADDQGFVLMQCPLCGEFFKIKPEDYHAEDVIEIWCPSCGLKAENYFTDDVIELALKKTKNYANDLKVHLSRSRQVKSHSMKKNILLSME